MHPYQEIDYSNLRPTPDVLKEPSESDIFENGNRKIYYNVPPNEKELNTIESFKKSWKETMDKRDVKDRFDIPSFWGQGDLLRYACTNEHNVQEMVKQVETHCKWLKSMENFRLMPQTAELLNIGAVYIGGRDKKGIPSLIMCVDKVKKMDEKTVNAMKQALCFCLLVIRKYMMLPKYIEKYHFIIDFNNAGVSISMDLVKGLISLFQDNFNGFAGMTYMIKPSWSFKILWKMIAVLLPEKTKKRIKFVASGEEKEVAAEMDPEDLQVKFGGNKPNYVNYWPPVPKRGVNPMTKTELVNRGIDPFSI